MASMPDRHSPHIREQARRLKVWVDQRHDAGHEVTDDDLWARVTAMQPRAGIDEVEAIIQVAGALGRQAAVPEGFPQMRETLLATLRQYCDGTYSDDPSSWSLAAGQGMELSIEDLVEGLAVAALRRGRQEPVDDLPPTPGP